MRTYVVWVDAADGADRPSDGLSVRWQSLLNRVLAIGAFGAGLVGWLAGRSVAVAIGGGDLATAHGWLTLPIAVVLAVVGGASVYMVDSLLGRPPARRVRIDPLAPALRFMPSRWAQWAPVAVAAVLVVPILAYGIAQIPPDPFVWATAIVGVPLALGVAVRWRAFPGLEVSTSGIRGVRFARRIELNWQELVSASVTDGRRPHLVITSVSGRRVIHPRWIGSDPVQVAAIIEFFRTRPHDRELLGVPLSAIDWVDDTVGY